MKKMQIPFLNLTHNLQIKNLQDNRRLIQRRKILFQVQQEVVVEFDLNFLAFASTRENLRAVHSILGVSNLLPFGHFSGMRPPHVRNMNDFCNFKHPVIAFKSNPNSNSDPRQKSLDGHLHAYNPLIHFFAVLQ